ncbi:hypothetical protein O7635_07220 [Asanoa sp. WMMD1127]|nr:hypothetical protein [Asanoa sp. WMMD1127]MDG4821643.1 hypothetical protein [Asanoa sp. WMMD1127]
MSETFLTWSVPIHPADADPLQVPYVFDSGSEDQLVVHADTVRAACRQ